MNIIQIGSLGSRNTKTEEYVRIANAIKEGNTDYIKSKLNNQQINSVNEILKRFK